MEITQRRTDGTLETNLISASVIEVEGEPSAISMTPDITDIKRVETSLRSSSAVSREDRRGPISIAPQAASPAILDRPLQILLAEDSLNNRALISAYLKKTSYLLVEAEDGQDAIDKFVVGNFDLVLMDIQMPNVDGYEATSTIRVWELANSRRRTPIVALTASAQEEAMERSMAAGCDAHMTKPVKQSTLLEGIREAIGGNLLDHDTTELANLKEETWRTGL